MTVRVIITLLPTPIIILILTHVITSISSLSLTVCVILIIQGVCKEILNRFFVVVTFPALSVITSSSEGTDRTILIFN